MLLDKGDGYFVQLGHSKKSTPEIYTAGKHFLISAGGANRGYYSQIVTRPITVFLEDSAKNLNDCFHLEGPGNDFMKWNNTGVYKNFACASGKVSVPEDYKPILERNNWAIYAGNNNVKIVVYSTEDIGIMLIFEDMKAEDLLANLEKSNANDEQLKTQFQFPDGQIITYDVNAHLNKWVIKSIDGKSVERDFSKWALINFESSVFK
jgi:hypothetical protein